MIHSKMFMNHSRLTLKCVEASMVEKDQNEAVFIKKQLLCLY